MQDIHSVVFDVINHQNWADSSYVISCLSASWSCSWQVSESLGFLQHSLLRSVCGLSRNGCNSAKNKHKRTWRTSRSESRSLTRINARKEVMTWHNTLEKICLNVGFLLYIALFMSPISRQPLGWMQIIRIDKGLKFQFSFSYGDIASLAPGNPFPYYLMQVTILCLINVLIIFERSSYI